MICRILARSVTHLAISTRAKREDCRKAARRMRPEGRINQRSAIINLSPPILWLENCFFPRYEQGRCASLAVSG